MEHSNFETIKLPLISEFMNHSLTLGVRYGYGEKFKDISQPNPVGKQVDCSGYFRWLIFHGSSGRVRFPDGSVNQRDACIKLGFQPVNYMDALKDRTGSVYAAFAIRNGHRANHVWVLRNGTEWESAPPAGIRHRSHLDVRLRFICTQCYKLS